MESFKILLNQQNVIVGDIEGNLNKARQAHQWAVEREIDLILFSELFITGYPPEDLILSPSFIEQSASAIEALAKDTKQGSACLIGAPFRENGKIYNAAFLLENGRVARIFHKTHLPNYEVFDEMRIFAQGTLSQAIPFRGARLGVRICEDIWIEDKQIKVKDQIDLLVVLNASPFHNQKMEQRLSYAKAYALAHQVPLIYVNQVGGQDELVFDGASFVMDAQGEVICQAPAWEDAKQISLWRKNNRAWVGEPCALAPIETGEAAIWRALVLGLRDYALKNHFKTVLIGLSGGVDSALTAAIACDAFGAQGVHCVMMASPFTQAESIADARLCADRLGVKLDDIPITQLMTMTMEVLSPFFEGLAHDLTEENIQSRIRGLLLMALSNKFGSLLLSTGNKSEISVGYATLYGDMNGGFNPIKDLYKSQVYSLAKYRNRHRPNNMLGVEGEIIPASIISKAPSAELREGQKDSDSLPPYDVLDDILIQLVDLEKPLEQIIAKGHPAHIVKQISQLVRKAEYKRRQSPPGVRIGTRSFGRDRRYPMTNHYKPETSL